MLGALKSENLVACGPIDNDGVDFTGADGAERFLKFVDALLQFAERMGFRREGRRGSWRSCFVFDALGFGRFVLHKSS
jgi:hypothetical protein